MNDRRLPPLFFKEYYKLSLFPNARPLKISGINAYARWTNLICLFTAVFLYLSVSYAAADSLQAIGHLNAVMDKYNSLASNELRFLESYETLGRKDLEKNLNDAAFVYDNALTLLVYLQQKGQDNFRRAKILADSFVFAAGHDRFYHDGRLRNAYSAKQLINPETGFANLLGEWDATSRQWREDKDQVSTHTGNMAWAAIALSRFYAERGGDAYKTTAISMGNWIRNSA